MSNTQLDELLPTLRRKKNCEIIRINTDARPRSLQFALIVRFSPELAVCRCRLEWFACPTSRLFPDERPCWDLRVIRAEMKANAKGTQC